MSNEELQAKLVEVDAERVRLMQENQRLKVQVEAWARQCDVLRAQLAGDQAVRLAHQTAHQTHAADPTPLANPAKQSG